MRNIIAIILIIISIGAFFFLTLPVYDSLSSVQQEIGSYDEALSTATELASARQEQQDAYNQVSEQNRTELAKLLPDSIDNIRLIIDIDGIASRYGLLIKGIRIDQGGAGASADAKTTNSQPANQATYGTIGLSFSVDATYGQIDAFLKDLERSQRLVDVTSLSFSSSDSGKDLYTFSLGLKTYWMK